MPNHYFISYSSADAADFALTLADALAAGPPPFPVWLDRRQLRPGADWDTQIAEAIRDCDALLFVMTLDSVEDASVCKQEWTRALRYKKPIVPLRLHPDAELPFRLGSRQFVDFAGAFEPALARLRQHLGWLTSPAGALQSLKDRLADARRDLRRAPEESRARVEAEIAQLEDQIAAQQRIVDDPAGAASRVAASIDAGIERERKPERPPGGEARSKFINPPPAVAPSYFQDRHVETGLLGRFLADGAQRMMTVVGRGGIGKTAMVCRLLKHLEAGRLPDDAGPLPVDGIVYLSASGTRRVNLPNLYADLCRLLPDAEAAALEALAKDPHMTPRARVEALLSHFPDGLTIVLLDNFEDLVDPETLALRDAELDEALRALLALPHHAVKVIITTRVAPKGLALVQPGRQARLNLDAGLPAPFAENILRAMDADGTVGLRGAPELLLAAARERTRGYPRALEALYAILAADRDTTLGEVLGAAGALLPENVVEVLVGEAFSRLDPLAQRVMQALAIYGRPATPTAVDYLLQPYLPGFDSAPALGRLVNMQFARKEAGRYYLHPVDRQYAFERVPEGEESDRQLADRPPWSQFALLHRGAEYYRQTRTPREEWRSLDDLAPQLAEFELRLEGRDHEVAASVAFEVDDALMQWGHYRLMAELYERLDGKLDDPGQRQWWASLLGGAYWRMGRVETAIARFEQALEESRGRQDRSGEGAQLGNLGNCYADLGDTARAVDYYEQALAIAEQTGNRGSVSAQLTNLGWRYSEMGLYDQAMDATERALAIDRELGSTYGVAICLSNLAGILLDLGRYDEAIAKAQESLEAGADLSSPTVDNWTFGFLALARLFKGELRDARYAAETACRSDEPQNNHSVQAIRGVVALRQGDRAAAEEAFAAALAQADGLLASSARNFNALDSKGVALAGLAQIGGRRAAPRAVAAFRAARAINRDAGAIARVLRLLDALALAGPAGLPEGVREAAAGET